jgi:transcriptional regulator with XRE-family HTH domain
VAGVSPTVRQRELGTRLRRLRNEHDMTVEEVAEKLLCSATKISRLETGARRPSLRDVRDLCALYEVDESTSAEFMSLARGAREQSWWTRYEDLDLDPYIGLEQAATAITYYSMYYVPALLQTEQYAKAIIKAIVPGIQADIYEQRVEARMHRQQLLELDNRPRFRVLLDEAVLTRHVGGSVVMGTQLSKMLNAEKQGKATIQIIPFDAGAHAAADSNFVLLEFEEESSNLPPIIYVESLTGGQYLERKTEIARYREALEHLRDLALSPRDSIKLMIELQKNYNNS